MVRHILRLALTVSLLGGALFAQEIQRGTMKVLDVNQGRVVVTVGGEDREFRLTERTQVLGATGADLAERLRDFQAGTDIFFKPGTGDDAGTLVGIKRAGSSNAKPGTRVSPDTAQLKPLTEMGDEPYQGFAGGLYPDGRNTRPESHEAAGLRLAQQVQPLDAAGKPDPAGRIVLLSIGMSNTSQASQGFQRWLDQAPGLNPRLVFVNGAQGGMTAAAIQNPDDGARGTTYWSTIDRRLEQAGVTREQVQAVWIKQADAGPNQGFPGYAQQLQSELARIVQLVTIRFPNCHLAYLSSRTYGGYATTKLNPEPYAFESGFSVKWLIEQQLDGEPGLNFSPEKGPVKSPWLSWGPYLWANGTTPRADGFRYEVADAAADGTHESAAGQSKVGKLMLDFFRTDATTRPWFLEK